VKSKDTLRSTVLRSVLADIYSADKQTSNNQVNSSAIISILRKAAARRTEAAAQYVAAARPDLADKETFEAELLSQFIPPVLSEAEVDNHLQKILDGLPASPQKPGNIFKLFYNVVDKSTVDAEMVKRRLDVLLKTPN
ncbi:GatB/YqeY domain-containing protein, partial [Mycena leptocephala]